MCSLELYNWYENQFPSDFKQLIQIKRYNISGLSFLLSKIWRKLDYGEKLLMCAVYYDDASLARQLLNEKLRFRVNPFCGKHYSTQQTMPFRSRTSYFSTSVSYCGSESTDRPTSTATTSPNAPNDAVADVSLSEVSLSPAFMQFKRRYSLTKDGKDCTCCQDLAAVDSTSTAATASTAANAKVRSSSSSFFCEAAQTRVSSIAGPSSTTTAATVSTKGGSTKYFFKQRISDVCLKTPFYFAVKLNNLAMCQLFVEHMRSSMMPLTPLHAKRLTRIEQLQYQDCLNLFYGAPPRCTSSSSAAGHQPAHISTHSGGLLGASGSAGHRATNSGVSGNHSGSVCLNSFLTNVQLIDLLCLSLNNRNYAISMLLLSHVSNPKEIIAFRNVSESFIYNKEFCLYLVRERVVEPRTLLREATLRHSSAVATAVLDYLDAAAASAKTTTARQAADNELHSLCKCVLDTALAIGDVKIFRAVIARAAAATAATTSAAMRAQHALASVDSIWANLTIESIINQSLGSSWSSSRRNRTSAMSGQSFQAEIDMEAVRQAALASHFEWDAYFALLSVDVGGCSGGSPSMSASAPVVHLSDFLSELSRLKLLRFLFASSKESTSQSAALTEAAGRNTYGPIEQAALVRQIRDDLQTTWLSLEMSCQRISTANDKHFECDEAVSDSDNAVKQQQQQPQQQQQQQQQQPNAATSATSDEASSTNSKVSNVASVSSPKPKRVYTGKYHRFDENEPFLINSLIERSQQPAYKISNRDLISVAKHGLYELTLYYLLSHVHFDAQSSTPDVLLDDPVDDVYGNFLEVLFCRLVRCVDYEQESRLRHIFLEAIVLKRAKMTCTANMLHLFLTSRQATRDKLLRVYFPCLFYLSCSFVVFRSDVYARRFRMLVNWLLASCFSAGDVISLDNNAPQQQPQQKLKESRPVVDGRIRLNALNAQQIESLVFELYARPCSKGKAVCVEPNLKQLARNALSKVKLLAMTTRTNNNSNFEFINQVNDSFRQFMFCFDEMKTLFSY